MQDFTKLVVWQRSHRLSLAVYRATGGFPVEERFGLCRQIRNAASSVEFNIAEGSGRRTKREFVNFLGIAAGSLSELRCQLLLRRSTPPRERDRRHPADVERTATVRRPGSIGAESLKARAGHSRRSGLRPSLSVLGSRGALASARRRPTPGSLRAEN